MLKYKFYNSDLTDTSSNFFGHDSLILLEIIQMKLL